MKVKELEEYRKAYSTEKLIKLEHKSRQMALALERKTEYYRSKADTYLEMLLELDSCELEEKE